MLMQVKEMRVDIETNSNLSAGQTVCDIWGQSKLAKNCLVVTSMDVDGFWDIMLNALYAADRASPFNTAGTS
jgi:uridine nucleosidase